MAVPIQSQNRKVSSLTGRDLHAEMASFCEEKLEFLYMFMTTCSNANIENLALRMKLEQDEIVDSDAKVLACLVMTANHFGEDHTSFLFTAEVCLVYRKEKLVLLLW